MPSIDTDVLSRDPLLLRVWKALGRARCHLTGGYLRDRLLGMDNTDLDLSIAGTPDESADHAHSLGKMLGSRPHLLGSAPHQVWRIETPEIKIELWPRGVTSLEQDIERRDFSCNALMWELPDGPLVNQVNGVEDLAGKKLRALSRGNLVADPVRLVRAPRLLAQMPGFELEERSADWIRSLSPKLASSPRERVGLELVKLLRAVRAELGLKTLLDLGLLAPAAPSDVDTEPDWLAENLEAFPRLAGREPQPVPGALRAAGDAARLAFLLRAWGAPDSQTIASYAWPRDDRGHAARAAALLERAVKTVNAAVAERRWFIHLAGTAFPATLVLAAAISPEHGDWRRWWRLWQKRGRELAAPEPLLSGEEVMSLLDLGPGRRLGTAFRAVTEAQIRGEVRSRKGALRWLRRWESKETLRDC
jgi:tRNA nucleotidyltransferase/poly(A) polymerase